MVKSLGLFILAISFVSSASFAQGTFRDAYNDFKQQAKENYEDFRKKANQEYANWMRQAWEWHDKIAPMPRPKDEMLPPVIYNKKEEKKEAKPVPYDDIVTAPTPNPQPKPFAPIRENEGDFRAVSFSFYGIEGCVRLPKTGSFKLRGKNEEAYAIAWEELSSELYDNLIRDCLVIRMEYQLCDWAYLMMLGAMSDAVCGKGTNESTMLQTFVLCQSGYRVRLCFTPKNDLRLLFKSEHLIYDLIGLELDDGIYYLTQPTEGDGLSVCDISYPEERPLSLLINQEQKFPEHMSQERLLIPADSLIAVRSQVNENLIQFYSTYPTSMIGENFVSRWAIYARTPLSENIKAKLYPQLIAIMNQFEDVVTATSWLLYWVQTSFVYEYDDIVWEQDRAFFAEETLYYPYCDCEDRSILFSRLVHDLLGLDVILVYYPGHLATAVSFNTAVEGDYIDVNGKRYTICDPTYIGAPIGATMPEMDNKTAKVVVF